jgi:hypothetical protein
VCARTCMNTYMYMCMQNKTLLQVRKNVKVDKIPINENIIQFYSMHHKTATS